VSCRRKTSMYLVAFAQLPNGATLDRTEAVMRELRTSRWLTGCPEMRLSFPGFRSTDSRTAQTRELCSLG